jgi:hypothetical protein
MLQMAVRSENVQRTARLELLEVAFAGFSEMILKRRAARNRALEAGVRLTAVADDDAEGKDAAAAFAPTPELLGPLLGEALRFARGETEQLTGLLRDFLENRVEVAGDHLRKLAPRSDYAGLMSAARVVATVSGSPVRA